MSLIRPVRHRKRVPADKVLKMPEKTPKAMQNSTSTSDICLESRMRILNQFNGNYLTAKLALKLLVTYKRIFSHISATVCRVSLELYFNLNNCSFLSFQMHFSIFNQIDFLHIHIKVFSEENRLRGLGHVNRRGEKDEAEVVRAMTVDGKTRREDQ